MTPDSKTNASDSSKEVNKSDFIKKWLAFFTIAFDPFFLIFLVAIVILIILEGQQTKTSYATKSLLTFFMSISSAVLGGYITKLWLEINEKGALYARGSSAVRGLKLLLNTILSMDARNRKYLIRNQNENFTEREINIILEEISEKLSILTEESVSSIENWTDYVPEAKIKTTIGKISELNAELNNKKNEVNILRKQVVEVQGTSDDEKENLLEDIEKKDNQIYELEEKIRQKSNALGFSSPITISGSEYINSNQFSSKLKFADTDIHVPTVIETSEVAGEIIPE